MKRGVAVAAAVVTAGSAAFAPTARALEGEQHVGVDTGPSVLVVNNKSTADIGATLGGHYSYSLSDAFNFMAEGAFSLVALGQKADDPKQAHTYPAWVANADVGIAYVFDVLRWVPYAGVARGCLRPVGCDHQRDEGPTRRGAGARSRLPLVADALLRRGGPRALSLRRTLRASPEPGRQLDLPKLHPSPSESRIRLGLVKSKKATPQESPLSKTCQLQRAAAK